MDSLVSINMYRPTSGSDHTNATKTDLDQPEATVTMQERLPASSKMQCPSQGECTWLDNKMEGMKMITDEEFGFDHPDLEEFLNSSPSCSPPANGSSSDSSFTSNFSADCSIAESLTGVNGEVDNDVHNVGETMSNDVECMDGKDVGDNVENEYRNVRKEEVVCSTKDFQSRGDSLLQKDSSADSLVVITDLEENSEVAQVTGYCLKKPKSSKLPTLSQNLKNHSTTTKYSQPINNTQPKEMNSTKGTTISDDSNDVISSSTDRTNTETQLSGMSYEDRDSRIDSNRSSFSNASSSDTCVNSRSSSVNTVTSLPTSEGKANVEDLNTSMTSVVSEASSVESSVSMESRKSYGKVALNKKGLRVPPVIGGKGRIGISNLKTKLSKPSSRISLLPSKALDTKVSKKAPLKTTLATTHTSTDKAKDGPIKKSLIQPMDIRTRNSRLSLFRPSQPQERKGGSMKELSNTDASKTLTFRGQQAPGGRVRKSSIPRSMPLSNLHKKTLTTSTIDVHAYEELGSTIVKSTSTIASEPSTVADGAIQLTPEKSSLATTTTPSRTRDLDKPTIVMSPTCSLEGSVPDSPQENFAYDSSVPKTPRTVTKRRSFIPTPGRIGKKDITPFNLQNCMKQNMTVARRIVSAADLDKENETSSSPSKQPTIKVRNPGEKKPKSVFGVTGRLAFKPRNGQSTRAKSSLPSKAMAFNPRDDTKMFRNFSKAKVVHSPVNKDDLPKTPPSKWSPIRRKQNFSEEESHYECTKRTYHV